MSTKKRYKKNNEVCKVTFRVPKEVSQGAKSICVVGDFNNWRAGDNPMKKLKSGEFTVEMELEAHREYEFRYLIDEKIWENDADADKYVRSEFGNCENSVIIV